MDISTFFFIKGEVKIKPARAGRTVVKKLAKNNFLI